MRRIAAGALGNYVGGERALAALATILREETDPVLRIRAESALEKAEKLPQPVG